MKISELHKSAIMELYKANEVEEEKQLFTAIVLRPDVPDAHGDIYSAEVVEKAAHNFMEHCQKANIQHLFATDAISFVESYCAPTDFTLGAGEVKKGDWVMTAKIHDETLWEMCKCGDFTGFSIGAAGLMETLNDDES